MSSMPALRYADPHTAGRYPLSVRGPADWQSRDGVCRLTVLLPKLEAGTIIVPSLTSSSADPAPSEAARRHQWTLTAGDAAWPLQEVPARSAPRPSPPGSPVSSHIDCFHVHRTVTGGELHLTLEGGDVPEHYLVTVTGRALTVADPAAPSRSAALPRTPAPLSQMTAPPDIAERICSPTCVAMVLGLFERPHDWLTLARECHDPVSGLFGIWPLALAAAARRGSLGAVEVFDAWSDPVRVLDAGLPVVTSIRFRDGELPGSPLTETGGHLVVMHGVSPATVSVCDPAAADGEVLRTYPAGAFSRAWLRHRGAAYILLP